MQGVKKLKVEICKHCGKIVKIMLEREEAKLVRVDFELFEGGNPRLQDVVSKVVWGEICKCKEDKETETISLK